MTSTTWSRPTRLKEFSSAMQPWISCALIMRGQHVAHRQQRLRDRGHGVAREPVGRGEDAAQVVGRMAPFGGEPGVVEIEPADHRADVEGGLDRVELELGARHLGAVRHDRARHDRAEQLGAGGILERLEAAAERVDQAVAGGFVGELAGDLVLRGRSRRCRPGPCRAPGGRWKRGWTLLQSPKRLVCLKCVAARPSSGPAAIVDPLRAPDRFDQAMLTRRVCGGNHTTTVTSSGPEWCRQSRSAGPDERSCRPGADRSSGS